MTITLCRVDDRLIHGQVVIGWGAPMGVDLIVVVDDAVQANAWEQEIYRMAVPEGTEVAFVTEAEAVGRLDQWAGGPERVFVLTGDVATMCALVRDSDGRIGRVNLGGVHDQVGRRERLRYLYLSDGEVDELRRLEAGGARVYAQDVPTAPAVGLDDLA